MLGMLGMQGRLRRLARVAAAAAVAVSAGLLLAPADAGAQIGADDPIEVEVKADLKGKEKLAPGDEFEVAIVFTPTGGYHIYAPDEPSEDYIKTTVEMEAVAGVEFEPAVFPASEIHESATGNTRVYEKPATVRVKGKAVGPFESDEIEIAAIVGYQACEKVCRFPIRGRVESATVKVVKGAAAAALDPGEGQGAGDGFGLPDPIRVEVKVDLKGKKALSPGDEFDVTVLFTPTGGYHIYAHDEDGETKTTVEIEPVAGVEFGKPVFPPHEIHKSALGETKIYEKPAPVVVKAKAVGPFTTPAIELRAKVGYGACKVQCLFPVEDRVVSATVPISGGGDAPVAPVPDKGAAAKAPADSPGALPPGVLVGGYLEPKEFLAFLDTFEKGEFVSGRWAGEKDDFSQKIDESLFLAFVAAFFGGILTSLTPCVYPMIPITVAFFGRQTGRKRSATLKLALVYVAGIVVTYSTLGLVAALTGAQFGGLLGNPVVVGVIAALFVAMALSSFGLFELQAPSWLLNKLPASGKGGGAGAFVMGLVLGIVAAPCVGPILVGILTWIAATRDPILGFSFLAVFALGMGVLFVVLAVSSRALPRAGGWMEVVKKVFGVLLFGVAVYYVAPLVSPEVTSVVIGLLLVAFAIHLAWPLLRKTEGESPSGTRLGIGALSAVAGLYFAVGLFVLPAEGALPNPKRLLAPPSAIAWNADLATGLGRAVAEKKPVLLDFTADWCKQCEEMDHLTFHDKDVLSRLEGYVPIRLDTTDPQGKEARSLRRFPIPGLPGVVLLTPEAAAHPW